jgi:hypothetical protein
MISFMSHSDSMERRYQRPHAFTDDAETEAMISFMSHSDSMERRYQHPHAFTDDAETEEKRDYGHGNSYVCQDQDDDEDLLLYDGSNHYYVYRDKDGGHLLSVSDEWNENEDEEDMMTGCFNDSLLTTAGCLFASLRFLAHADG